MYSSENCKILKSDFDRRYRNLFMQMYIQMVYGDELVLGSTLLDNENSGDEHE